MAILLHERFEKDKEVSSPETADNVEKKRNFSEEKDYDDDFENRLSQVKREGCKHLVFSAIADANPDYGKGGGNQYFIQRAFELKENGGLKLQSQMVLGFDPEKGVFKADVHDSEEMRKTQSKIVDNMNVNPFFKIHLDKREMTEDMVKQLVNLPKEGLSEEMEDMTSEIDDAELKYLDENTIAAEGLTQIEDEQDEDGKKHEDRLRPLGNQEDSGGKNHPDSWSNPAELKEGSMYFQVSPILKDGTSETKSSYFTDEKTIDSCKDAKGIISVSALLQKLQIEPKKERVMDENGNVKEEYVKKYMLSSFLYTGNADR